MENIDSIINKVDETSLAHSFYDACSDKEFKDFVYGLNIKEEILMKYTSTLQDAFIEYKNCEKCRSLSTCKNKLKGFRYTPEGQENIIVFDYVACSKQMKDEKNKEYEKNLKLYEKPSSVKEALFKDIYKDDKNRLPIIKYFKEFIDNYDNDDKPKGLYLHGSFGSGKTYLIAALFNEMARRGVSSTMIYYPEFLRSLKASFNAENNDFEDRFDYVKKVPITIIR